MGIEKQVDIRKRVQKTLARFSFVQWDRFVAGRANWSFYGWIARSDAREDFLILDFWANGKGKRDVVGQFGPFPRYGHPAVEQRDTTSD